MLRQLLGDPTCSKHARGDARSFSAGINKRVHPPRLAASVNSDFQVWLSTQVLTWRDPLQAIEGLDGGHGCVYYRLPGCRSGCRHHPFYLLDQGVHFRQHFLHKCFI